MGSAERRGLTRRTARACADVAVPVCERVGEHNTAREISRPRSPLAEKIQNANTMEVHGSCCVVFLESTLSKMSLSLLPEYCTYTPTCKE